MHLVWKLPELLEQHNITVYRLRKTMLENGVPIASNTAYRWVKDLPDSISVPHLTGMLEALRQLTGKKLTLDDLFDVDETEQPDLFDKGAS